MRLLVSVATAAEALEALAGGADVIDAKDPAAGALGAVPADTLRRIHCVVAGARPVTAALGDASDESAIERAASAYADAGALLVKVGFADVTSVEHVATLIEAAVRGTASVSTSAGVVAVGYADGNCAAAPASMTFVQTAARSGASGVLLDTADKSGAGLRELVAPHDLGRWIAEAHRAGLFVALAGKLTADDLAYVRDAGADIAGVRGAACDYGRTGRVVANKVRALRALCAATAVELPLHRNCFDHAHD
jgi:(5-formylfuran-3-yl)methyl phosphate synthase